MTATIQSYVVHPEPDHLQEVTAALAALPGCEVLPAENRPVLVLVTETADRAAQRELERQLETVEHVAHLALVSGWNDDEENPA
ncbi:MAG: chaperone NapD [Bryobacterales bacterium]|nr:chaperone NapD [Bryobacterales bacterium]